MAPVKKSFCLRFCVILYLILLLLSKGIISYLVERTLFFDFAIITVSILMFCFICFFFDKAIFECETNNNNIEGTWNRPLIFYTTCYIIYNSICLLVSLGKFYGRSLDTNDIICLISFLFLCIFDVIIGGIFMFTNRKHSNPPLWNYY